METKKPASARRASHGPVEPLAAREAVPEVALLRRALRDLSAAEKNLREEILDRTRRAQARRSRLVPVRSPALVDRRAQVVAAVDRAKTDVSEVIRALSDASAFPHDVHVAKLLKGTPLAAFSGSERRESKPSSASTAEQLRVQWLDQGVLVSSDALATAWSRTRQALDEARARGDLFGVRVKNRWCYPAVFGGLAFADVKCVNKALLGEDSVGKLIFWTRPQGALGGQSIARTVADAGASSRVLELAQGWSAERGLK